MSSLLNPTLIRRAYALRHGLRPPLDPRQVTARALRRRSDWPAMMRVAQLSQSRMLLEKNARQWRADYAWRMMTAEQKRWRSVVAPWSMAMLALYQDMFKERRSA